jgi:type IV pilus assembly protein PilC
MSSATFSRSTLFASLFRAAPLKRLESFCQRLGMGLRSGVDLLKILEHEEKGNQRHRQVVEEMKKQIRSGETLVGAMEKSKEYFPPLLLQMVSAGEISGGLDRIFAYMAEYYRELRSARSDFFRKLVKPSIQLLAALAVISGIILLQGFLQSPHAPAEEQFDALGLGLKGMDGLMKFWSFVALVALVLAMIVIGIWKNAMNCHRWLIPLVLPIPVIGAVFLNTALARLSMTLSMLLNAGADAILCVKQSFLATGNEYYIAGMDAAIQSVQRGDALAVAFENSGVVPQDFIDGVAVGELSGNETESLERIASEYQRKASESLSRLCTLASVAIVTLTSLLIIFLILRLAMQYVAMLQSFMPK